MIAQMSLYKDKQPLLPEAGAGGPALMAVISVISFLATLALAGYLLITSASHEWTRELRSALTIQIPGETNQAIEDRTAMAVRVLETTEGVVDFRVMRPEEAEKLLQPWLGEGEVSSYFSVPAIIEVRADASLQGDISLLKSRMGAVAPGALVNDHSNWKSRLVTSVRSAQILSFCVFLLVMIATCAIAVFAARAGLAANHDIVSILHLVGASDQFIAGQVQKRFLVLGLRGAIAGVLIAIFVLFLISVATRTGTLEATFIPGFTLTLGLILTLMLVPVITCLVTAITARFIVLHTLKQSF